jgi:hypothetical protein
MHGEFHTAEEKCVPLSIVTVAVTSKHATQLSRKASVHMLASMLRSGAVSTLLVDLVMTVNRCTWPSEEAGRGHTKVHMHMEESAWRHRDGAL